MQFGKYTLRPYQAEAHNAILEHIRKQRDEYEKTRCIKNAVFEAYVAAGKSAIMGSIAHHCASRGGKVLMLARQGELVEQNSEALTDMGMPNSIYSASLGQKSIDKNVVIGTEGTVAKALDGDFLQWIPHVILIDECHMLDINDMAGECKSQYAQIINHFRRINPRLYVIGFTGTPYRGIDSIFGGFWSEHLQPIIGRKFLVENGYIVPTIFGFGHDDVKYNLDQFKPKSDIGTKDFSSSELQEMADCMDLTTTQQIMREVVQISENRNGVLITCASRKHCEEAASVLQDGTWGIITQDLGDKARRTLLNEIKNGDKKYLLQIGCVSTGFDAPLIDTSVILRRIGSLTLLVQLLGRGMRLLKQCHIDAGYEKHDHLCLDYSGTMEAMHSMFEDPLIESAELERAKKEGQVKTCPDCGAINSEHARRCINTDLNGNRCEFFWSSKECPHCKAVNDTTARDCRKCGETLIDPNLALKGKHYTEADFKDVVSMDMQPTRNGGILVLINFADGDVAKMFFNPWSSNGAKRVWQQSFVNTYVNGWQWRNKIMAMKSAEAVCKMKAMFNVPVKATHRINEKGKSVVHGVQFRSKRVMGGKVV